MKKKNQIDIAKLSNKFIQPIEDYVEMNNNLIVRLVPKTISGNQENVYCLSNDGTIKWRIDSSQFPELIPAYYMNIAIINDELKAFNFGGYDCTVDLETGKVIECEFVK